MMQLAYQTIDLLKWSEERLVCGVFSLALRLISGPSVSSSSLWGLASASLRTSLGLGLTKERPGQGYQKAGGTGNGHFSSIPFLFFFFFLLNILH